MSIHQNNQSIPSDDSTCDHRKMTVIESCADQFAAEDYVSRSRRPVAVIATGGTCTGGRNVNYLTAMLGDPGLRSFYGLSGGR
jgi:hypothetical protein